MRVLEVCIIHLLITGPCNEIETMLNMLWSVIDGQRHTWRLERAGAVLLLLLLSTVLLLWVTLDVAVLTSGIGGGSSTSTSSSSVVPGCDKLKFCFILFYFISFFFKFDVAATH